MNAERLGRLVRTLRLRQRLTQAQLAIRAGVSRQAVSMLERGRLDDLHLRTILAVAAAVGGRIDLRMLWNGPELDRLLDADHAALSAAVKRRLERWGWVVRVEVSYSRYGERGRIDLLAWHPATRTLLVIEIKTDLVDVQALLGSLDVKTRLAPYAAEAFGWSVGAVIPAVIFLENRTVRRRVVELHTLFDRFELRGRRAVTWLRSPAGIPRGLLWFASVSSARGAQASARRVRSRSSS